MPGRLVGCTRLAPALRALAPRAIADLPRMLSGGAAGEVRTTRATTGTLAAARTPRAATGALAGTRTSRVAALAPTPWARRGRPAPAAYLGSPGAAVPLTAAVRTPASTGLGLAASWTSGGQGGGRPPAARCLSTGVAAGAAELDREAQVPPADGSSVSGGGGEGAGARDGSGGGGGHPPAPERARRRAATPALTPGALHGLPMVSTRRELVSGSFRKAERTGPNWKLKSEAARARNRSARRMDVVMKALCGPLREYEEGFVDPSTLHPFDAALVELTVGAERYREATRRVVALRRGVQARCKARAARASKAAGLRDAEREGAEGLAEVREFVSGPAGDCVDELREVARDLRRLPRVDPAVPTLALVGAPNVGKSSLVAALSSGTPEVRDYPFTTRCVKVGHFFVDGIRHQVTDTPGVLNRPDLRRNAMELLTLSTLEHLPTLAIFVADLTGACGTAVDDQAAIRAELRSRFPRDDWIDVFSKADLLGDVFAEADAGRDEPARGSTPSRGGVGGREGQGGGGGEGELEAGAVCEAGVGDPSAVARPPPAVVPASREDRSRAVAFARSTPGALRVASTTGDGIDELKEAVVSALLARARAAEEAEAGLV